MKKIIRFNAKRLKYLYSILCPYEDMDLFLDTDFYNIDYLEQYIAMFKGDNDPNSIKFIALAKKQITLLKENNL